MGGFGQICISRITEGTLPIVLLIKRVSGVRMSSESGISPQSCSTEMPAHGMPVSASAPVTPKRQANNSKSGQSTAAIIVRLVNLRLARRSAAITSAPISRGSAVVKRASSASVAITPLIVWLRSGGWLGTSGMSRVTAMTDPVMRSCQTTQMTAKTMTRATSAGTPQATRNVAKLRLPISPIRMFCGLPMKVAAEPALVEAARAMTKGLGSRPRACTPAMSSGTRAKMTMSLASTAARAPQIATVRARSTIGGPGASVIQRAHLS